MKKYIIIILVVLFLSGCATKGTIVNMPANMFEKKYYTRTNLWYLPPRVISTWSYHKGTILPLGTEVTIMEVEKNKITFETNEHKEFTLVRSRHTRGPLQNLFDLYFSKENVLSKAGGFHKLSETEQANVLISTVALDMSKESVLLAYGYPPAQDGSADIDDDLWTYWGPTRHEAKIYVYFRNNISYKIERLMQSIRGPFGIRRSRIDKEVLSESDKRIILNKNKNDSANKSSLSQELEKLGELYSSGLLTDEEFKKAKDKLLNK